MSAMSGIAIRNVELATCTPGAYSAHSTPFLLVPSLRKRWSHNPARVPVLITRKTSSRNVYAFIPSSFRSFSSLGLSSPPLHFTTESVHSGSSSYAKAVHFSTVLSTVGTLVFSVLYRGLIPSWARGQAKTSFNLSKRINTTGKLPQHQMRNVEGSLRTTDTTAVEGSK